MDNPNKFLVISTWNSIEDWKNWQNNAKRKKFQEELRELMRCAEKTIVYTYL